MSLDWRVRSRAGISLVALVVANPTATPRRVRVANRLDGPVRPPRREGVPEVGWDDGGFEGVVAAGAARPLGYACPAPPADPPAELVWTERAGETERAGASDYVAETRHDEAAATETPATGARDREATPESVVRALGTARPPADAVPSADPDPAADPDLPDAVASWLSGVEERATRGDDGIDPAGDGLDPAPEDRAALAAVADRVAALRAGESADPPTTDARRSP